MAASQTPLICVVGETASGKSALALRLAQQFDGEVICGDSWTVRREMDIGTAKPTAQDRALVPHHLLDIVGPDEDFTAAVFKRLAQAAIEDISARGKLPVMVGGTGLYIDSVLYDFGFLAAGDRGARAELNNLSVTELLKKVHDLGLVTDNVDTHNKRRLIRLIETDGAIPTRQELRENTFIIGLKTDREILQRRIISRVDTMLTDGLEDEVQTLSDRYGWEAEGLKGVGYAQWREYFAGAQSLPETRQKIIKANLDLAKRQRTWFKRNKSIRWFTTPVKWLDIVDSVTTFLNTGA
jgi:tRNA dimethylallyltransferase